MYNRKRSKPRQDVPHSRGGTEEETRDGANRRSAPSESYQFGLRSIFLLTAFVALALAMRDDALVRFLIYFACNAIACAVIFGVPLWLASWRDR